MATVPDERCARLTVMQSITGNRISCVLHYLADSSIVGADLENLINEFVTNVIPAWMDCVSLELHVEAISAYCVQKETVLPSVQYQSGVVGTIASESLPANTSAVLQLRQTEDSGRHNGRLFITGITEGQTLDGLMTTGAATTEFAALATALQTPLTPSGKTWTLGVLQRMVNLTPITPVGLPVSLVRVTRNIATQRRRTTELREFHP